MANWSLADASGYCEYEAKCATSKAGAWEREGSKSRLSALLEELPKPSRPEFVLQLLASQT